MSTGGAAGRSASLHPRPGIHLAALRRWQPLRLLRCSVASPLSRPMLGCACGSSRGRCLGEQEWSRIPGTTRLIRIDIKSPVHIDPAAGGYDRRWRHVEGGCASQCRERDHIEDDGSTGFGDAQLREATIRLIYDDLDQHREIRRMPELGVCFACGCQLVLIYVVEALVHGDYVEGEGNMYPAERGGVPCLDVGNINIVQRLCGSPLFDVYPVMGDYSKPRGRGSGAGDRESCHRHELECDPRSVASPW